MAYQPPPPYSAKPYPYPPPAGGGTTIIVTPQPTVVHKSNRGLFGTLDAVGRSISGAIDGTAHEINRVVDSSWSGPIQSMFQTQNIVQIISRASGHCLQIVADGHGRLVVDGLGGTGPGAYNAVWTVINEGSNEVRLHNNNNYLAIMNGETIVMNVPPGSPLGVETKLRLSTISQQFVTFESVNKYGHHVGVLPSGQLKKALATGQELHAQFGIKVISTYGGK